MRIEYRIWQGVAGIACLVPLVTGTSGVLRGAAMLRGVAAPVPPDLDSHFRYLSGIFLMLGIAFAWSIVGIERRAGTFRLLCAMVVCGGLARLLSLVEVGVPGKGHVFGLAMELGAVPLLMLWQRTVERKSR